MSDRGAPIYLVDDDVSVRESVGSLIRSAGFRAEAFASAQECLASLQAEVPSCLVLDVQLPGLAASAMAAGALGGTGLGIGAPLPTAHRP